MNIPFTGGFPRHEIVWEHEVLVLASHDEFGMLGSTWGKATQSSLHGSGEYNVQMSHLR